jgi:hypothetical protein
MLHTCWLAWLCVFCLACRPPCRAPSHNISKQANELVPTAQPRAVRASSSLCLQHGALSGCPALARPCVRMCVFGQQDSSGKKSYSSLFIKANLLNSAYSSFEVLL